MDRLLLLATQMASLHAWENDARDNDRSLVPVASSNAYDPIRKEVLG